MSPFNSKISIHEGKTTPPKPYTEGQLITLMKTCGKFVEDNEETEILKEIEGLGTEATRSGIIETIKKHDYIQVTKNIVSLTDKGRILCEAIEGSLTCKPFDDREMGNLFTKNRQWRWCSRSLFKQYREISRFIDSKCS